MEQIAVDPTSITLDRQTLDHLRRIRRAEAEAAYEAQEREYLHQRLAEASFLIDYGLYLGLIQLRDADGKLILKLDQWLAAVQAGKWPGEVKT
jgi:hypothetical protein